MSDERDAMKWKRSPNGLFLVIMPNGDLQADRGDDVPDDIDGYVRDEHDLWRLHPINPANAARARRLCGHCRGL